MNYFEWRHVTISYRKNAENVGKFFKAKDFEKSTHFSFYLFQLTIFPRLYKPKVEIEIDNTSKRRMCQFFKVIIYERAPKFKADQNVYLFIWSTATARFKNKNQIKYQLYLWQNFDKANASHQ